MRATTKASSFFIVTLLVFSSLSLVILTPVHAQSTPAPAVPQFTLKLVGPPIVVNTTYSLDPNTGKIIANIGYTNPYSRLEINVTNQAPSSTYGLPCLDVQVEVQPNGGWEDFYAQAAYDAAHNGPFSWINAQFTDPTPYPCEEAGTNYTIIGTGADTQGLQGSTLDIQVRAFWSLSNPSAWSPTQTITVPANTPLSPNPTPTASPTATASATQNPVQTAVGKASSASFYEVTSAVALVVIAFLLVVIIGLLVYMRKRKTA